MSEENLDQNAGQTQPTEIEQQKGKKNKKEVVDKKGRVVVKKKGGCGTFFAGFFFAIIFLVLTIGGAGAYVYFCVNFQQIESLIGVKLPLEGDLNKKTIKELVALGLDLKDSYVHIKIGELETKVGIKLPEKFPGTEIDISYLYEPDATINYKGTNQKFMEIEVMDAINNLNSMFDGVLNVLYDHITVGEILKTADLEETIQDMGWPALCDPIYDISGTKKKLADLTINQAKDVLVDYYGADNLTIQKLIDATNIVAIPNKPMYNTLRGLKVQKITTQQILDNVTGEILNDLLDLTAFDFTQTDEFNQTALSGMIDYIQTLYLGDFITLENCVEDDYFTNHPTFATLKKVYVSKLNDAILGLKVNQILTAEQIARTSLSSSQVALTLPQLLQTNPTQTIFSLFGAQNVNEVGAYIKELQLTTTANFTTEFNNLTWAKKLGLENSSTALLELSSLTIQDIAESEDIPETIFNKLGTLGDLIGSTDNSVMQLISKVKLTDLLTNAGDAIMEALEYDEDHNQTTLATLLGMSDTSGINGIVSAIKVKALLDTPNEAISSALKSSTSTLGELLEMSSSATGINAIIKDITVGALFNTPDTAIKNALEGSDTTLGELLEMTDNTGINSIVSGITVGALFGDPDDAIKNALNTSETTLAVLLGMTSSDGINGIVGGIKVKDLFTSPDTAIKTALQGNHQTLKAFLGATTTPNTIADYVLTNLEVADLFDETNVATTLQTTIEDMPLTLIMAKPTTGFLALVSDADYNATTVGTIDNLVTSVDVTSITLEELDEKGIIDLSGTTIDKTSPKWAAIKGFSIVDIIQAYYNSI